MNDLFLRVLNMSVTGCYVILAVLAARFLLRKAPKKYSYALWAAAGFRLVCPVSFRSVLSLFSLRPFQSVRQSGSGMTFIPDPVVYEPVPTVSSAVDAVEQTVSSTLPAVTTPIAPSVAPAATVNPIQTILLIAMILWLAGMAVMATVSIVNYIQLKKELQFAIRLEGNIWQSEAVRSPFILGIWKPKIYIPYGLDDQTRQTILAHEQYHLQRLDHWVKVFAFGVLTLHWFNPLCHVAFHLMSRDMEMSCDEHVLAEKSIETTKYSESLLAIATNRRFPAATPLAFAETGVRERMINVLKWRKPRTWVTVTAILVSVLMLVSCVADPRLSEPKVDDVTLLEFPGVKWGATPEEVKEALSITEKQISSEWADEDGEEYFLTVKDITFFGEKVPIAGFQFRSLHTNPLRLFNVTLYLDENTDMEKMQETLSQAYNNEGTGEYYLYYSMEAQTTEFNTETGMVEQSDYILKEHKRSGDPNLWFIANNPPSGASGASFREAANMILNDPDFKEYNWVSPVKGTEVFSAADLEALIAHYSSQIPHEVVQEWMEKVPLVRMSIANRSFAAARAEVNGTTEGEATLATHNQVILDANVLIFFTEQFEVAAKNAASPKVDDVTLLEFPGVKWFATPEELKEALNITQDQIISEYTDPPKEDQARDYDYYYLYVTDLVLFDRDVTIAAFRFRRDPGYDFGFETATVFFADDTDMVELKEYLTDIYGPGLDNEYKFYTAYGENGEKTQYLTHSSIMVQNLKYQANAGYRYIEGLEGNPFKDALESPDYMTHTWITTSGDFLETEGIMDYFKAIMDEPHNADKAILQDDALLEEMLNQFPWIYINIGNQCSGTILRDATGQATELTSYSTNNYMEFSATFLSNYRHLSQ